jgi:hypothetical protein
MNVPETTSKGRPSLHSETAPGGPDNSSRILASLEGRVSAQQLPRRRSKKPWAIAAVLAVIGAGALGAWQWQRSQDAGHAVVASGASHAAAGASAATVVNASGAAAASARVAQSGQDAASSSQAAVIVADNTASSPAVTGTDPLSRALTNGASSTDNATAAVGASSAAVAGKQSAAAAQAPHESAKNHRAEKHAAERGGKHAKNRAAPKHDDPDVDLLAALVARTKPYDAHAPQKSASDAKAAAAKGRPVSLAAQIKRCDEANFFEAQLCRWRVCADHWGKDPACRSSNSEQQTR